MIYKYYLIPQVDLESTLSNKELKHRNKYEFVMSQIKEQQVQNGVYSCNGYVNLKSDYIRKVTTTKRYSQVMDTLKDNYIETDDSYIVGRKSYSYRFKEPISKCKLVKYIPDKATTTKLDQLPFERTIDEYQTKQLGNLTLDDRAFIHQFENYSSKIPVERVNKLIVNKSQTDTNTDISPYDVTFLFDQNVIRYDNKVFDLKKLEPELYNRYQVRKMLLDRFKNSNEPAFRDTTSRRLHSKLTRFPKDCRKFLKTRNNQNLCGIDIKNAQPLLIYHLMTENYFPIKNDAVEFYKYAKNGILYEHLMEVMNWSGSRSDFKRWFYIYVLYGREYRNEGLIMFRKRFPSVAQFLSMYKEVKHEHLAIDLQRLESFLVLDTITERIKHEKEYDIFLATIHDSLVTETDNSNFVECVIKEEFEKIGLEVKLRIDTYV